MEDNQRLPVVLSCLSQDECLTTETLAAKVAEIAPRMNRKDTVRVIGRLISLGHAERREVGCYMLTAEGAAHLAAGAKYRPGPQGKLNTIRRPRRTTFRDLLWKALRIRKKASVPELVELAGEKGKSSAKDFMAALVKAGICAELRRQPGTAITSNGFKRYALIKDVGPATPLVRRGGKEVFDPNSGEIIAIGGAQ